MRITTRLRLISTAMLGVLLIVAVVLVWTFYEFKNAKEEFVLAGLVQDVFFESDSARNQYFIFREDRWRQQYEKTVAATNRLLQQVGTHQRLNERVQWLVQRMQRNTEDRAALFHRLVSNINRLNTDVGNNAVYEELGKRLSSQQMLQAVAFRDMVADLLEASAQRVERSYQYMALSFALLVILLALVTLLTARQIRRFMSQGLAPLHAGAKKIASGDLGYRIPSAGADEFVELASSFNDMTAKLQAFTQQLEAEISTRKRSEEQLSELNRNFVTFLENTSDFIYFKDEHSRFRFCSQPLAQITGHASWRDLLGKHDSEVFPPETAQIYQEEEVPIWRNGQALLNRIDPFFDAAGKQGWVSTSKWPLLDQDGKVVGLFGISRDITEQKKASDALAEALSRLQKITSRVPGIVVIQILRRADGSFCVPYASDALRDIYRVSPDAVREDAAPLMAAVHPDDFPHLLAAYKASAKNMGPLQHEFRLKFKDEPDVWLVSNSIPQREAQGAVLWCGFITDITERKRTLAHLANSEERFRGFFEKNFSVMLLIEPASDRIIDANETAVRFYGYPRERLVGMPVSEINTLAAPFIHVELQRAVREECNVFQFTHRLASGKMRAVEVYATPIISDGRTFLLSIVHDITERKQGEEKLQLAASVFLHAREGIMITDSKGTIIDVNDAFSHITGYSHDEVLGQNPSLLGSGIQNHEFYDGMWRELLEKGHWYGEIWNRHKNGEVYATMQTISSVRDAGGHARQYVSLLSDITSLKAHESQLEHLAHYDALTNLPNRVLLSDRLHQGMAQEQRRGLILAVAFLDLDGFKAINDRHGHEVGDKLLVAMAQSMKQTLREGDTLARIGGDEFVALLLDLPDIAASEELLTRLLAAAAQPVRVGELEIQVSASLGVSFYPQAEEVDSDLLLRQADQAMYQAKLAGRNRYSVFDLKLERSLRGHHESLERIRRALTVGEFVLYYQPKVNMHTGAVVSTEALIRWQHPEQGLLLPAEFLPVIEDHPLAVELGEWVINTALTQMEVWRAAGLSIPVSVNIGARQLQQGDFVARLRSMLVAHQNVDPNSLELEILETSALQDIAQVSQLIDACSAIGVTFALDDFGTGYSSLTYLKRLKVAALKIDQSFVRDMLEDPDDLAILEGVIGLAAAFHRQVIAEGVETVAHGTSLLKLGCYLAQGFCIARPMPANELLPWLAARQPEPSWLAPL